MVFFWDVQLSEYAAVVAAATATLTELYEPLLLDDNLRPPVWKSKFYGASIDETPAR